MRLLSEREIIQVSGGMELPRFDPDNICVNTTMPHISNPKYEGLDGPLKFALDMLAWMSIEIDNAEQGCGVPASDGS